VLDFHGDLGTEEGGSAIEVILKMDAFLGDPAKLGQRKYLETAAVREERPIPAGKVVESSKVLDHPHARPHEEVVGVSEDNLGPQLLQFSGTYRLDGALSSDRHENGCLNDSMRSRETAATGPAGGIAMEEFKHAVWLGIDSTCGGSRGGWIGAGYAGVDDEECGRRCLVKLEEGVAHVRFLLPCQVQAQLGMIE
jgi:hypothetical protein